MVTSPVSASRRRGAELEDALLDAAWAVLVEHGYESFSYEAVAAKASTSRAVIYRRWPKRGDLVLATLLRYSGTHPLTVPDTGTLRGDALAFLRNADELNHRFVTLMSVHIIDYFVESGSSPRDVRNAALAQHGGVSSFEAIVARAVQRGEIPDLPRSSLLVNFPLDMFRHELFMTLQPMSPMKMAQILDELWLPLMRMSQPSQSSSRAKRRND